MMNRRGYLQSLARAGLGGILFLAAGLLLSRKQVRVEPSCGLEKACRSCRRLETCSYTEAVKERENGKR